MSFIGEQFRNILKGHVRKFEHIIFRPILVVFLSLALDVRVLAVVLFTCFQSLCCLLFCVWVVHKWLCRDV